jgi:hypothetical protein
MIISQRVQFDVTALAFDDQYPPELKDKFSKEEFTDIVHTCSRNYLAKLIVSDCASES